MLFRHIRNHPHLLPCKHHTGGVTGVGNHNGTGILGNKTFDAGAVRVTVAFLRISGKRTDHTTCCMHKGGVVGVIRFGNDHFGIGIQDAETGQKQRLAAACGDINILVIQMNTKLGIVVLHSIQQFRNAGRCRIGERCIIKTADRIKKLRRCLYIRLADIQVIYLFPLPLGFHRKRVELSHRRRFAAVCIDRNFHKYLHWHPGCRFSFYIVSEDEPKPG